MIYKPEHIVDLESGAVISAEIRHGDEGDTAGLADRIAAAAGKVEAIHGEDHDAGSSRVLELAADKGYHDAIELAVIRHETGMRTVIPDPSRGRRRMGKFAKEVRVAPRTAERAEASPSGRALLRARGAHLERGFAHVLECGGLRRTYLRGRENIARRYRCGIIAFDFTLRMRKLFGTGKPRLMAAAGRAFLPSWGGSWRSDRLPQTAARDTIYHGSPAEHSPPGRFHASGGKGVFLQAPKADGHVLAKFALPAGFPLQGNVNL